MLDVRGLLVVATAWACLVALTSVQGQIAVLSKSQGQPQELLHVVWFAPKEAISDGSRPMFSAATSIGALALATDRAYTEGILGGKTFNLTWIDSACDAKESLGQLTLYLQDRRPDLIVGPPCTEAMQPVSDLAAFLNIPVFGWVSNDAVLDNKTRASTLVRTLPPLSGLGNLMLTLCKNYKWDRLAIISTKGSLTEPVADFLKETVESTPDIFLARHFQNVSPTAQKAEIAQKLRELKTEARIIVLIVHEELLRDYMLAAYDNGMTSGDYQFLYTRQTLAPSSFLNTLRSEALWRRNDSRDAHALQAYKNLLYFTFSFILEWDVQRFAESVNASQRLFQHNNITIPDFDLNQRDLYSRFLHDAVYLYCLAYNETVSQNRTPSGTNIFKQAINIQFQGLTGHVAIDNRGDRLPSFFVWDMAPNNTFNIVVNLTNYRNQTGHIVDEFVRHEPGIYWGNGLSEDDYIPPAVPICGFEGEDCPPDRTVEKVVPSVLVTVMLAGFVVFVLLYRWWKKEQELYKRNWRVKWNQLEFDEPKSLVTNLQHSKQMGSRSSLDSEHSLSGGNYALSGPPSAALPPHPKDAHGSPSNYYPTAHLAGTRVAVRMIRKKNIRSDRDLLEEMRIVTKLKHVNLASFHGVSIEPPNLCVLWEYCHKGSVQDLFYACRHNDYKLDSMVQFSIAMDICSGLHYLHTSELKVHGNLKSSNCLIDNRWTCKLSGFGMQCLLKGEKAKPDEDEQTRYSRLFWTAPEVLRQKLREDSVCEGRLKSPVPLRQYTKNQNASQRLFWTAPESLRLLLKEDGAFRPTQPADIYSAAVVLKEVMCKNQAYEEEVHVKGMTPKDIIYKVSAPQGDTLFRPAICELPGEPAGVVYNFVRLIHACWQEDPNLRPNSRKLLHHLKKINPYRTANMLDNMLNMMERYSSRLEELVAERTSQLEDEKRKTDALLYRMLPQKVAEDLKGGKEVQAEAFTSVTIYFSDIVGFTHIASESTPMQIVEFLNSLYTVFDDVIRNFDVYKVETIGDAYMVVSGIPVANGTRHVSIMANMSLKIIQAVLGFFIPHMPHEQLKIRVGLNTGPVVAGVVGNIMPRYCLFGDTVNLASRMESHGVPLKIHISPYTYEMLKEHPKFIIAERGLTEIKGKGKMMTYFLEGRIGRMEDDTDEEEDDNDDSTDNSEPAPNEVNQHLHNHTPVDLSPPYGRSPRTAMLDNYV